MYENSDERMSRQLTATVLEDLPEKGYAKGKHELKKILTGGTFFSAQVTLQTYIFSGNGVLNKIYHIYVNKLRVPDRGYGTAWQIPVPSLPSAGSSTPGKKHKERDEAADDAFQAFDAASPKKMF
ncbi:hypothetical protein B0H14DRAFT_2621595 [Mycena olivaceomarginata]|nr:hypothetical protein B0H14DRAFT_2621595 [Mycena olivaceomarginata]